MLNKLSKSKRYDSTAILLCFIILLISLILGSAHKVGTFAVETDFYGEYANQTKNILSGKPYTYLHNPPGYEIFLGGIFLITQDLFTAAKIISSFSTVILGLLSYLIFKKLYNEKIALISIIFLFIILLPHSFTASTDIPGAMFATIPILLLLCTEKINLKSCSIMGLACGVAYLVRADSIYILIGILIVLLFVQNSDRWQRKIFNAGVLILGFILITSPWFIYNWKMNGSPLATTAYIQVGQYFYGDEDFEKQNLLEKTMSKNPTSPHLIFIKPEQLLWKYIRDLPRRSEAFITHALPFPVYIFLGGGIIFFLLNLDRKRLTYFTIWLSGFLIIGLIAFALRHYFIFLPFISFLLVYFLFNEEFLNGSKVTKKIIWGLVLVCTIFLVKDSYKKSKAFFDSEPRYLLKTAEFIRSRSSKDDLMIARKPHLAYLSNIRRKFIFEYTPEGFLEEAKYLHARYIVYSDLEATTWSGLSVLSNPDSLPKDFKLIYQHKPSHTLIYEITYN